MPGHSHAHDHDDDHNPSEHKDFLTKYAEKWELITTLLATTLWIVSQLSSRENSDITFDMESLWKFLMGAGVGLFSAYGAARCHARLNEDNQTTKEVIKSHYGAIERDPHENVMNSENSRYVDQFSFAEITELAGDWFSHMLEFAIPVTSVIALANKEPLSLEWNIASTTACLMLGGLASFADARACANVALKKRQEQDVHMHATYLSSSSKEEKEESIDSWVKLSGIAEVIKNFTSIGYWTGSFIDQIFSLPPYQLELSKQGLIVSNVTALLSMGCIYYHIKINKNYSKQPTLHITYQDPEQIPLLSKETSTHTEEEKYATTVPITTSLTLGQKLALPGDIISHLVDAVGTPTFLVLEQTRDKYPWVALASTIGIFATGAAASYANIRACKNNVLKLNAKEEKQAEPRTPSQP